MTQRFNASQIDAVTRAYLKAVSSSGGRNMPGIYHASSDYMPLIGIIFGICFLLATFLITFPPTEEPTKEAFLKTAGFLPGIWMIVAAIRVFLARSTGKRFGSFIYADSQNLYEVNGEQIDITNLEFLEQAKAVQQQGESGYTGTDIEVILKRDSRKIKINGMIPGKRMTVFLNALVYVRDGGEDGNDEKLMGLSNYDRAAYARHIAFNGDFPRSQAYVDEIEKIEIPSPAMGIGTQKSESGLIGYLAIIVMGSILFVTCRAYNKSTRETTIYNRILELNEKDRPPALRMFLSHPEFTVHRQDAQTRLENAYKKAAENMINGQNPEFSQAMRDLVIALAQKPQPVVSLSIDDSSAPGANGIESNLKEALSTKLADTWGSTIGDELITFVKLEDPEIKSMIHISIKVEGNRLEYTITFRKGPEEAEYQTIKGTYSPPLGILMEQGFADHIMTQSCGLTRMRIPPIIDDF